VDSYSLGRGIKLQFVSGAGLNVRFLIASGISKSNSSMYFLRLVDVGSTHIFTDHEDSLYPHNGRLTPTVLEEGLFIMIPSHLKQQSQDRIEGMNTSRKNVAVKMLTPHIVTFNLKNMKKQ
jgi:hypothetical protein